MAGICNAETELPERLRPLMKELRRRAFEWVNDIAGDIIQAQHEDMTIYGPFGGEAARVSEGLDERQAQVRSQFKDGTSQVELVQAIDAGDTVILVLKETNRVMFPCHDVPHPWNLRVTEVYVDDGGSWRRVHRHADPLFKRRPLEETLALLD